MKIRSKMLRKPAVSGKTGYSTSHIDRLSADPTSDFPEKIQLGPNAVGWFEDDIDAWLECRRRGALAKTIEKPAAANSSNESPADPANDNGDGTTSDDEVARHDR